MTCYDQSYLKTAIDIVNDVLARHWEETIGREPNWRYFDVGRTVNQPARRGYPMFAWTTQRDSNGKFQSFVWQPSQGGWIRKKTVSHSKRKAAKARALKMRNAYAGKKS
jgi:hypothetical protein